MMVSQPDRQIAHFRHHRKPGNCWLFARNPSEGRQQREESVNHLCREVMVLSGLRGVAEWDCRPKMRERDSPTLH